MSAKRYEMSAISRGSTKLMRPPTPGLVACNARAECRHHSVRMWKSSACAQCGRCECAQQISVSKAEERYRADRWGDCDVLRTCFSVARTRR